MESFKELGKTKCRILQTNDANIRECAKKITEGKLVIFPTETVFGIGANGLDKDAISKIFTIKNRPAKNPMILHCLGVHDSLPFLDITEQEKQIYKILANEFWPGPLTIVAKSSDMVPEIVRAGSEFAAFRAPSDKNARKLIQYSMVPIAAPSANMSGKTSPTCLDHVLKYFDLNDIDILNEEGYTCKYGIESTVLKIIGNTIIILRHGFITKTEIGKLFDKKDLKIYIKSESDECNEFSGPGQLKSHYCPDKPLYVLNFVDYGDKFNIEKHKNEIKNVVDEYLDNSILIDFNSMAFKFKDKFMGYVDLSKSGDFKEAMFNLYNVFHQVSDIECKKIFVFNFSHIKNEHNDALWNRIIRASEGKNIAIPIQMLDI